MTLRQDVPQPEIKEKKKIAQQKGVSIECLLQSIALFLSSRSDLSFDEALAIEASEEAFSKGDFFSVSSVKELNAYA